MASVGNVLITIDLQTGVIIGAGNTVTEAENGLFNTNGPIVRSQRPLIDEIFCKLLTAIYSGKPAIDLKTSDPTTIVRDDTFPLPCTGPHVASTPTAASSGDVRASGTAQPETGRTTLEPTRPKDLAEEPLPPEEPRFWEISLTYDATLTVPDNDRLVLVELTLDKPIPNDSGSMVLFSPAKDGSLPSSPADPSDKFSFASYVGTDNDQPAETTCLRFKIKKDAAAGFIQKIKDKPNARVFLAHFQPRPSGRDR